LLLRIETMIEKYHEMNDGQSENGCVAAAVFYKRLL